MEELLDKLIPAALIAATGLLWKIGHELTKLRVVIENIKTDIKEIRSDIDNIEEDIDKLEDE